MPDPRSQLDSAAHPTTPWRTPAAEASGLVLGRYRILERIGGGGMGTVYKALHVHLKQTVAIKTIRLDRRPGQEAALVDRFRREMEAVGAIQHPHVVRATDGGEEDGLYFLVMEYVPGTDLDRLVQKLGPLPVADACELIRQAALGLACVHACGWVHRDIKPSNLLLSPEGVVKIADLGLARVWDHPEQNAGLTPEGCLVGTPDYLAPEQANNAQSADVRSDIYSLGCSLFRLLTGQPPYPAPRFSTYAQKLLAHQLEPIPRVEEVSAALGQPVDPAVLRPVGAVLQRMLAKDPGERYPDPEGVVEALGPLASGSDLTRLWERLQGGDSLPPETKDEVSSAARMPTPGRQEGSTGDAPAQARFSWKVAVGVLTLLAVGLIGLVVYLGLFGRTDTPPFDGGVEEKPSAPPTVSEVVLDQLPELRWHNLLERPPKVVLWPRGDGASQWHYDRDLHQLSVQTERLGLLQMGEAQSPHYVLRVGLLQSRWRGGIGLYLGCRLPDETGAEGRLQFVQLREQKGRGGLRQLNLTRGFVELRREKDGSLTGTPTAVGSHTLGDLRGEQTLEVTVADRSLRRVRVNGVDLRDLLESTVHQHFTPVDHAGGIGVLVGASDGVFRNAQFMRLNEAP